MGKNTFINEPKLPLVICGYEAITAQDVFLLTRALDGYLKRTLESYGYVQRSNIELLDGQIVNGWVKI